MAATFTPLADALENGTYALEDIIFALAFAGELTSGGSVETEMGDLNYGLAGGKLVYFTYSWNGAQALQLTGLSIDFAALQAAVVTADSGEGDFTALREAFRGIDFFGDFSDLEGSVNVIYGTGGDDNFKLSDQDDVVLLDGGTDWIKMGAGKDTIKVGSALFVSPGTSKVEGGAGIDQLTLEDGNLKPGVVVDLTKTVTFKTDDGTFKVQFTDVEDVRGTALDDRILGTSGANSIFGGLGEDEITGRGGADILTGYGDADTFTYADVKDSGRGAKADTITDFVAGIDHIDLSDIDPKTKNDKFTFIGDDGFSKRAGQLRYEQHDAFGFDDDYTLVQADTNGDRKVDLEIRLSGLIDLHKGDFIL